MRTDVLKALPLDAAACLIGSLWAMASAAGGGSGVSQMSLVRYVDTIVTVANSNLKTGSPGAYSVQAGALSFGAA
jgi:hypothetical protein